MFIVVEGIDGSGKSTQFNLLAERLRAAGHEVDIYKFPRYNQPSSYFIQQYLGGEYGPASEVSPYTASLFYALDRFEAAPQIRQSLADGKIVMADRYAGSNMAHQGSKFSRPGEKRGFFVWEDSLEFQLLGIPRPTLNLFLRVPAEVSRRLIKQRDESYDEHESDIEHLRKTVSTFDTLCQLFPKDFKAIDCTKNNKLLPVTEINNRIWNTVKPLLPVPKHAGHSTVINLSHKPRQPLPADQSKEAATPQEVSTEIKDVSLLALNSLASGGISASYALRWPPSGSKPRLNYFIPSELPPELAQKYKLTMERLAENSRKLNSALAAVEKRYVDHIAPLAALVDVKVRNGEQTVRDLFSGTSPEPLNEIRQITKRAREDLKEPRALKQIIHRIAESSLGVDNSDFQRQVRLIMATPRNELDLLADCLYRYSNLSRDEIAGQIDKWTYEQKASALKEVCASDPDAILDKITYRFDVLDNRLNLENLAKNLMPTGVQTQPPTVRYGYQVPKALEKKSLDELYIECFDLSLTLYSDIQAAGMEELAGYAVLMGHRQRWQFTTDGQSIFNQTQDSDTIRRLKEQISEIHPLISSATRISGSRESQSVEKTLSAPKKTASRRTRKKRGTKSKK